MGEFPAIIPLAARAQLTTAAIRADLKKGSWLNLPVPETVEAPASAIAFKIGDSLVTISLVKKPFVVPNLKATVNIQQPHVPDHFGHLNINITSDELPIEQARVLTRVCSSVLATCQQALGVFWTGSGFFVPRSTFQEKARDLMPTAMPVELWVDIVVGGSKSGKSWGVARGLAALGFKDVETDNADETPAKVRERLAGLALYMLENGVMPKHGDNLGVDTKERIEVNYAPSRLGLPGEVMRLEFGAPQPAKKGWFKKV